MPAPSPERMSMDFLDDHSQHPHRTNSNNPLSMTNEMESASSNNDLLGQTVYAFQLTSAAAPSPHRPSAAEEPQPTTATAMENTQLTFSNATPATDKDVATPLLANKSSSDHHDLMMRQASGCSSMMATSPALSNVTALPATTPKTSSTRVTRQFHTVPLATVDLTYSVAAINEAAMVKSSSPKFNPSRRGSATSGMGGTVGSAVSLSDAASMSNTNASRSGAPFTQPSLYERVQAFHELHQREGYLQPYHWDGETVSIVKKPPPPHLSSSPDIPSFNSASGGHHPVNLLFEELRPFFDPRNNETYPIVTHHQILLVVPDEAVTAQVGHYARKMNGLNSNASNDAPLSRNNTGGSPSGPTQGSDDNFPFQEDSTIRTPVSGEPQQQQQQQQRGKKGGPPPLLSLSPSAINENSSVNTPTNPTPVSTTSGVWAGGNGAGMNRGAGAGMGRSQSMASFLSEASTDTSWRHQGVRPRIARLLTRSATRVPRNPALFLYAAPPGTVAVYPAQPQGNIPIGPTIIQTTKRVENPEAPEAPQHAATQHKTASHPHGRTESELSTSNNTAPHSRTKVVQVDYFPYSQQSQDAGSGAAYYTSGVSSAAALRRRLLQEKQVM